MCQGRGGVCQGLGRAGVRVLDGRVVAGVAEGERWIHEPFRIWVKAWRGLGE